MAATSRAYRRGRTKEGSRLQEPLPGRRNEGILGKLHRQRILERWTPLLRFAQCIPLPQGAVAGCTCNGKDPVGLASIKPDDDKTLRRGDLIARETGLEVVKRVEEGNVSFAKVYAATQNKFDRVPVVAAQ
jgi:hypothetical protein